MSNEKQVGWEMFMNKDSDATNPNIVKMCRSIADEQAAAFIYEQPVRGV